MFEIFYGIVSVFAAWNPCCTTRFASGVNAACNLSPHSAQTVSGLAASPFSHQPVPVQDSGPKKHRPRRSACAEASLRAEIKRVGRMTIEERVKAALSMGERFSWVKDIAKQD